mgnify:CR=1 FL=1
MTTRAFVELGRDKGGDFWTVDGERLPTRFNDHETLDLVARAIGGRQYAVDSGAWAQEYARRCHSNISGEDALSRLLDRLDRLDRSVRAASRSFIGWWGERESRKVRRSFEYAGAGWEGETVPGRYELHVSGTYPWFCARLDAIHTKSWFQNRIGAHYGSNNLKTERAPDHYGVQLDRYGAAEAALQGKVHLAQNWEVFHTGDFHTERKWNNEREEWDTSRGREIVRIQKREA